jgi:hypothetical protein
MNLMLGPWDKRSLKAKPCLPLVFDNATSCSRIVESWDGTDSGADTTRLENQTVVISFTASPQGMPADWTLHFLATLTRGRITKQSITQFTRFSPHQLCAPKDKTMQSVCYCNTTVKPEMYLPPVGEVLKKMWEPNDF